MVYIVLIMKSFFLARSTIVAFKGVFPSYF